MFCGVVGYVQTDYPAMPMNDLAEYQATGDYQAEEDTAYLSDQYFATQSLFDRGNFIEALQQYGDEIRSVVQGGRSHWVDSICYHARVGECH